MRNFPYSFSLIAFKSSICIQPDINFVTNEDNFATFYHFRVNKSHDPSLLLLHVPVSVAPMPPSFPGYHSSKMAASDELLTLDKWHMFFESLLKILDDCDRVGSDAEREVLSRRLDYAIIALQHILPLLPDDTADGVFIRELSENFRSIRTERNFRQNVSVPSQVGVYSLDPPPVSRTHSVGRPRLEISEEVLLQFRSFGFKWQQIADMLLVSRWTIRRRVEEFGIRDMTGFSEITDDQLDVNIRQFVHDHGNQVGCGIITGHLGIRVQRRRVRAALTRIDPENSRLRWAIVISRRSYSVPGPNSLWHIDGHHSLVTWGFVIHGGIDGFSRFIVYLKCSTNNRSDTQEELFLNATTNFGWPSRVRTDYGGENVQIWEVMEEVRGPNRGSYLVGSSVHNQRIERLWRDVFCLVTHVYYYTFQAMEESGILQRENPLHKFILHYIFCPRINRCLESFISAWNNHPLRTERNWSPLQMWTNGMVNIRNQDQIGVSDVASTLGQDDFQWYGYDPHAPAPDDGGLSTVEVEDVILDLDNIDTVIQTLMNEVDPLQSSNDFGIDLYLRGLDVAVRVINTG